jgi:56kDa selenium binding protein (SBP56)
VHCGPEGIYLSALGAPDGGGPGGIFLMDHFDFNVLGRWEVDRGPQELAYDFWWHLGHDTLITSEWGTPNKIENGLDPEHLLSSGYGHQLHVWNLRKRKHEQTIDLGKEHQMVLELRPSHDPTRTFGFVGVVVSLKDLSASIWLWTSPTRASANAQVFAIRVRMPSGLHIDRLAAVLVVQYFTSVPVLVPLASRIDLMQILGGGSAQVHASGRTNRAGFL